MIPQIRRGIVEAAPGMQEIPDELRDFILSYIDSVAQLGALLVLHVDPTLGWTSLNLTIVFTLLLTKPSRCCKA